MFEQLDSSSWVVVITLVAFLSAWIGYFADAILEEHGFGMPINSLTVMVGGFAGMKVLEYAFDHSHLSLRYSTPYCWFASAVTGGTVLLLSLCLTRRLIRV